MHVGFNLRTDHLADSEANNKRILKIQLFVRISKSVLIFITHWLLTIYFQLFRRRLKRLGVLIRLISTPEDEIG
jgi:hypothetical protein